jgi:hypothetical protein
VPTIAAGRSSAAALARREETFKVWKASMQASPNARTSWSLGGLAMCLLGYDFHLRPKPPSRSRQRVAAYIETCIEAFGYNRAMFETNFPPDRASAAIR